MDSIIIFAAKYLIFLLALGWFSSWLLIPKTKRKFYLIFFALSFVLAIIGDKLLGSLFNNPRPFVTEGIKPLVEHTADNGFPSGHTLWSMMFATTTFSFNQKLGIILGLLALLVGVGRILAHVHHSIDILGSIALAIGATYLAWIVVKKYFKKV
jgi:undecaprenyl-diphosphatase